MQLQCDSNDVTSLLHQTIDVLSPIWHIVMTRINVDQFWTNFNEIWIQEKYFLPRKCTWKCVTSSFKCWPFCFLSLKVLEQFKFLSEHHENFDNFRFYWELLITEVLNTKITVFFFFGIFLLQATPRRHSFDTPVVILHVQGFILKSRCHAQVKLNPLYIESWSLTLYVLHFFSHHTWKQTILSNLIASNFVLKSFLDVAAFMVKVEELSFILKEFNDFFISYTSR